MSKNVKSAIQEFNEYSKENLYSIKQIKFWLKEHNDHCNLANLNWNNASCYDDLPCCHTLNNNQHKLIYFYESLNKISEYHQSELYFKQELIHYHNIKNNLSAVKNWLSKNGKKGF